MMMDVYSGLSVIVVHYDVWEAESAGRLPLAKVAGVAGRS